MKRIFMMLVLLGCGSKDAEDSGSVADPTVGVTGNYNILPGAVTGCTTGVGDEAKSEDFWVVDWATGLLVLGGSSDALTYSFPLAEPDPFEFTGSMTDDLSFNLYGEVFFAGTVDERDGLTDVDVTASLTMSGAGTGVKRDDGCWKLTGEFTVTVNEGDDTIDENDCDLEVPFEASQLKGDDCTGF